MTGGPLPNRIGNVMDTRKCTLIALDAWGFDRLLGRIGQAQAIVESGVVLEWPAV